MADYPPRLGDLIDDHCPRCRLLLNHDISSLSDGRVAKVYPSVDPAVHATQILADAAARAVHLVAQSIKRSRAGLGLPDHPAGAFLFTGQGSQYVNMLRPLRDTEPLVAETFAEADRELAHLLERAVEQRRVGAEQLAHRGGVVHTDVEVGVVDDLARQPELDPALRH